MKAIACSISNRALSRVAHQERELARREEMKRELLEEMNLRELVRYEGSFRTSEVEADRKRCRLGTQEELAAQRLLRAAKAAAE